MSTHLPLLEPEERVLSTLESDGSRRWLYPKLAKGRFLTARRMVAWGLIALYALLPFVKIGGKQALLLDIMHGEFTIFGATFLPTDTVLLAILVITLLLSVFAATAVAGRVWCGWACPQTVYMEFVFRPIERLFLGKSGVGGKPSKDVPGYRYVLMYLAYLLICIHLANMFLAYFVGVENLHHWIWTSPPWAHPSAFAVVAVVTGLMMFDFGYWREQLCIIGCPYGRFQSVLLDRHSTIVGYDVKRGEPRGKLRKGTERTEGDCIDCHQCVVVCPTGIDIRDGLQLECVGCTQCIDACDSIMDRIGKPRGLVRYSSQAALDGEPKKLVRARLAIYLTAITALVTLLTVLIITKSPFDFTPLRGLGRAFVIDTAGQVENTVRANLVNRTAQPRTYTLEVLGNDKVVLRTQRAAGEAITIPPRETLVEPIYLVAPLDQFNSGRINLTLRATDDTGAVLERPFVMFGPTASSAVPTPSQEPSS